MADIKLVISIPEDLYKASHIDTRHVDTIEIPLKIIANGIPLSKDHDRLLILSEDKLKENLMNLDFSCQKWISEVNLYNSTVAIIEADIESEEEE